MALPPARSACAAALAGVALAACAAPPRPPAPPDGPAAAASRGGRGCPATAAALAEPAAVVVRGVPSPAGLASPAEPAPGDDAASAPAGCTLLVAWRDGSLEGSARTLAREAVASERRVGVRRRANPEHARAKAELEGRGEGRGGGGSGSGGRRGSTGDLGLDLLGLAVTGAVGGVEALVHRGRRARARERLAAAPSHLEEPVYEAYEVDLRTVELRRRATLRAALVDPAAGTVRSIELPVEDRREARVGSNLSEADRRLLEGAVDWYLPDAARADLRRPPAVSAGEVLAAAAAELAAAPARTAAAAAILAEWRAAPAPAPPEADAIATRSDATHGVDTAVVRVEGMAGRGYGVYVAEGQVLTARALVGATSLLKIEATDGLVTYGVLDREDPILGVALVHVQRAGSPVALAPEVTLLPAQVDAEPGSPLFADDRLAGLAVPDEADGVVEGAALAELLGRWGERARAAPPP